MVVEVDITWLERVFGNLIQNAFKFTNPMDKISVRVHKDRENVYTEIASDAKRGREAAQSAESKGGTE